MRRQHELVFFRSESHQRAAQQRSVLKIERVGYNVYEECIELARARGRLEGRQIAQRQCERRRIDHQQQHPIRAECRVQRLVARNQLRQCIAQRRRIECAEKAQPHRLVECQRRVAAHLRARPDLALRLG